MTISPAPTEHALPTELADALNAHWLALTEQSPAFEQIAPAERSEIVATWAGSEFITHWCSRNPRLFETLWFSGQFKQTHQRSHLASILSKALQSVDDETRLKQQLRELRNRKMVTIAWRDLNHSATLEETLAALSDLADLLVQAALDWCYADQITQIHGAPRNAQGKSQHLVVLGLGKLGGKELNFSSDIDLIFAYPETGQTDGRRVQSNEQFFTRLCQRLIQVLSDTTAQGMVFRVDMRLRPFGASGALVMHFAAMLNYYQQHGREWERYALLKARVIAGDRDAGKALLVGLRDFVYRRYLDYSSLESLRDLKQMISREAARKGMGDHLKLGPGGIREVEFITQLFQLVYGGQDQHLRSTQLLPTLNYLGKRGLLPEDTVQELIHAYTFLRLSENRLQMIADRQVHALPLNDLDRWRLAHNMRFSRWETFLETLNTHRSRVAQHFAEVFGSQRSTDATHPSEVDQLTSYWQSLHQAASHDLEALRTAGYHDITTVDAALKDFAQDRRVGVLSPKSKERLDRIMPNVLYAVACQDNPEITLQRLLQLLLTIVQRGVYLSLLAEQPQVIDHLAKLCSASAWIADYVAKYPILLDELISPATLYHPPHRPGLKRSIDTRTGRIPPTDEEQLLDSLRHFKHAQELRVAAADIVAAIPLMQVSNHLTWIAEVTVKKVLEIACNNLIARHGRPHYQRNGQTHEAGFLVLGYGKLGGYEMGYSSDLDLVFLYDAGGEQQHSDGMRPLDNSSFFSRLGQRIIHLLSVFTAAGELYEVDLRLRPSGNSGLLVSGIEAFEKYQRDEAWTWEHQALVRARPIAGSPHLARAFQRIRAQILTLPRESIHLQKEIREMRERMWVEHGVMETTRFDLKKSPGGITDIEFMVQYLVLAHAHAHPELCRWTDNVRILLTLAQSGIVDLLAAEQLIDAYTVLRNEIHHRNLRGDAMVVDDDRYAMERRIVKRYWQRYLMTPTQAGRPGSG